MVGSHGDVVIIRTIPVGNLGVLALGVLNFESRNILIGADQVGKSKKALDPALYICYTKPYPMSYTGT